MNNLRFLTFLLLVMGTIISLAYFYKRQQTTAVTSANTNISKLAQNNQKSQINQNPLSIEVMRKKSYPGSDLTIEQTLPPGSNYNQYIASYKSDGLKIYGLLTVPIGDPSTSSGRGKPKNGWPVVVFNHGYIPPEQYQTTERYVAYVDGFARNGYIVFKPDYRGHGNSEGKSEGAYYSPAYTIDVLNAVASIKKFGEVNPDKIGMWGHSLGGNITLRVMVVSHDIKAGVIWAGVIGTYDELLTKWRRVGSRQPSNKEIAGHVNTIRQNFIDKYGTPGQNPEFWHSFDPRFFLEDISGPLQLHQGLADTEVPFLFSESLKNDLEKQGKTVELYTYNGADHNLSSPAFELAMQKSVNFFNKFLKGGESYEK